MKKKFKSLAIEIPIILNLFIAILLFISIFTLVKMSRDSINKEIYRGFQTTVKGYATFLDSWAVNQLILSDTYSSFTLVVNYMQYRRPEDEANMFKILASMTAKNPYVTSLSLIENDGTIINNSVNDNKNVGKKVSELYPDLWNKYNNSKKTSLSDSIYKGNDDKWITACISPINSIEDNSQIGGLLVTLDWQKVIEEFLNNIGSDFNFEKRIFIINHDTQMIIHNLLDQIGKTTPSTAFKSIANQKEGILKFNNVGASKSCFFYSATIQPWQIAASIPDYLLFESSNKILIIGIVIGVVGIAISVFMGFIYIKNLMKPLKILVEEANEMSEGKFVLRKFKFKRNEIGDIAYSFKNMRDAMVKIINEVNDTSEKINAAALELTKGSDDLSARTDAQAASLEETSSAIEEMASTIKSSASHSVEGNDMMISSKKAVENGASVISETTKNIEEVYEASSKIKNITKTIEDIAFQTNILALNASVEAARAGDQGRGFAVVASEVRNLAQNSQSSAKDITLLIENIYEKINKSAETARESQAIFNDIQEKIENTAKIMQEISTTAVEQQTGVDQVNIAVSKIDGITQQNATLVDETSGSAKELLEQAQNLKHIMTFFKMK